MNTQQVTQEDLCKMGYSSILDYFDRIYTLDMDAGGFSTEGEFMYVDLSEEQQAEYEKFATAKYYKMQDVKNNNL